MKKTLVLLFSWLILSNAYAQDTQDNMLFEHNNEFLGNAKTIQMPSCKDKDFEAKIIEAAEKYFENQSSFSTKLKRKKFLTLKNLGDFEVVSAEKFLPETDFNTANALVTIKINEHVEEKDILLCRQKQNNKSPIYVIAFPYMDNVKAYLINLAQENPDYKAVSFIYP